LVCQRCGYGLYRASTRTSQRTIYYYRFHEKAGQSQVDSFAFLLDNVFLPPSSHCRHASIRTLEERIVSLGAHWAFSFQPVLPSA
jgi:hypothetical protein